MNVQCTPDRNGIEIGNAASILVPDHEVDHYHAVLVWDYPDRKAVTGRLKGIADITA